jgi:stress-induced morphogen
MCPVRFKRLLFIPVHTLNNISVLGGCGSFYAITIASESFKGLSTVKQHKLVTEALKQEIEGIHGLQVLPAFYFSSLRDL